MPIATDSSSSSQFSASSLLCLAAPSSAVQKIKGKIVIGFMFALINEPAKKPTAKPLVAVAKNGSKTVKQESSSDEDISEDESNDDSDDVS